MDQNRFTEKSLEALSAAQRLAAKLNHQQMDVEHLLLSLLDQERGLASSLLNKAEIPVDGLKLKVHRELEKLPRVGRETARKIVEHRERHGAFQRAEDLIMVSGMTDKKFREIRKLIKVE